MKTLSLVFSGLFLVRLSAAQEAAPAPEPVPDAVVEAASKVVSAVVVEAELEAAKPAAEGEVAAAAAEAAAPKAPEAIPYNRGELFVEHHQGVTFYYRDGEEMAAWDYSAKLLTLLIECRGPGQSDPVVYKGAVKKKGAPAPAFSSDSAVPILHPLQEAGTSEEVVARYRERGFCEDYKNEKEREDRRRNIKPRGKSKMEKKSYYRNE